LAHISKKRCQINIPEHYPSKDAQDNELVPSFGDLSQSEKNSEIKAIVSELKGREIGKFNS
jgi:hypothetical protein